MSNELLPCPFCGGNDLELSQHDKSSLFVWVHCNSCGADGTPSEEGEESVNLWNTRNVGNVAVAWQYRYSNDDIITDWRDCDRSTYIRHRAFGRPSDVRELFTQPKESVPLDIDEIDRCWFDTSDVTEDRHVAFAQQLEKYILSKLGIRVIGS